MPCVLRKLAETTCYCRCPIVMKRSLWLQQVVNIVTQSWCHAEIDKAVPQLLCTFKLCISATWSLFCAFHIPCTPIPEIIDMHGVYVVNGQYILVVCVLFKWMGNRRHYAEMPRRCMPNNIRQREIVLWSTLCVYHSKMKCMKCH